MSFATGSLVRAREREWVVLPGSTDDLLMVRPLGGTEQETTGILTSLETVAPASFDLPDATKLGDHRSGALLRDALRLGFRSSAGPFRSFGKIAVEPRPYQLVPLLVALRHDVVRLLIADDVGVGKTVEAGLIAKELLEQGDASRLAVLCPPHLAEQWQRELNEKFNIPAEVVLPSTAARLERGLPAGTSLFEANPFVVVSIDFIKSDRYKDEFVRTCPELVIVDEAHGCTLGAERGRQRRHDLVKRLSEDTGRHLILVTATPHSGKQDAFGSLLELVDPSLADLPEDLSGKGNETARRKLARYLVQRRRADIQDYLGTETSLPDRLESEETYKLSDDYRRLFDRVLAYAREIVRDEAGGQQRRRVRWWSALALLRSLASSPAAAAATLRNRAATADTATEEEADEVGRRTVLDIADDETMEGIDVTPGADTEDESEESKTRRRLRDFAKEADTLRSAKDHKLQKAILLVKEFIKDGYRPIVFCRFIATAEYLAEELRKALPKGVEVTAVTGLLPHEERERRVAAMADHDKRVLIATDCLSEGINLQDHFDAVMHYDLSWNPTRHEQREGRVDRFGQQRPEVRALTFYGVDNQIDGIVLDVLIRKSRAIRKQLGVSVPVPEDTDSVMNAVFEGVLLREDQGSISADRLPGFEDFFRPKREDLHRQWDRAAEREKVSRTIFAQATLRPDEVERELLATRQAVGDSADVRRFVEESVGRLEGIVRPSNGLVELDLHPITASVRDLLTPAQSVIVTYEQPVPEGATYLTRTSPLVENLASFVLDSTLDSGSDRAIARRCAVTRTDRVDRRTTLLLLRMRFDVITERRGADDTRLAEDARLLAFRGAPGQPEWLEATEAEQLLGLAPTANIPADQSRPLVEEVVAGYPTLQPRIDQEAERVAAELADAHARVREAARAGAGSVRVEPKLPVDVLGIYVFVPQPKAGD